MLTLRNETVYGVWNTIAGMNSTISSSGSGIGDYYPGEDPDNILDQNTSSKYTNFGRCNASYISTPADCGLNTGFYLKLSQGAMILSAMRFCTANSFPSRDPMTMTVEGSNQTTTSLLTLGSIWNLIYNGSTGLDSDPGRYSYGHTMIFSNTKAFISYRILILTARNLSSAIQYAEVDFIG